MSSYSEEDSVLLLRLSNLACFGSIHPLYDS